MCIRDRFKELEKDQPKERFTLGITDDVTGLSLPEVCLLYTSAIKDILNETQPVPVTIEKIVGEVSRTFNVSPADIRGTKRNANVASGEKKSSPTICLRRLVALYKIPDVSSCLTT